MAEVKNNLRKQNLSDNSIEKPYVKILWTGGYDSTYRMVQLSKYDVTIQPYYLCDNVRYSKQKELDAIKAITGDIEIHPDTKCTILPLIKYNVADIEPDKVISDAFKRLLKVTFIGPQYEWLARFAKTNHGLELCLEKGESGNAYGCIVKNGVIKKITDGDIAYCIIAEEKSDPDLIKIFGAYRFPLPLFEITKSDMLEEYRRLGFGHTMSKTWFCHRPVNNEPCGICHPCETVIDEGLTFRLSPAGLKRHKTEIKYGDYKWYVYLKKFRRRIVGY